MIVLDASAAVALILNSPTSAADTLRVRLSLEGESVCGPHLIDVEVAHALRRRVLLRTTSARHATTALTVFRQLPIIRYPHYPLLERMWQLRENVTAYDATYLALSEALDAPLLTLDGRLATAPGHHASIEVV